ncbi:MAG: glycosyltransferase [Maritimibacter sp.]
MITGTFALLALVTFTLLSHPPLPTTELRPVAASGATASDPGDVDIREALACPAGNALHKCARDANMALGPALASLPRSQFTTYAFLPVWPATNLFSLEENLDRIDVLMPRLYTLELGGEGFQDVGAGAQHLQDMQPMLASRGGMTELLPVLQIWTKLNTAPHQHIGAEQLVGELNDKLSTAIISAHNKGLCLSAESDDKQGKVIALDLARALNARTDWADKTTCLVTSAGSLAGWTEDESALFDTIVISPDSDSGEATFPAPLAPARSAKALAAALAGRSDLDKFVIALGTVSADWTSAASHPEMRSYADAMASIGQAGGRLEFSRMAANSYTEFLDQSGNVHTLWMQDAGSAFPWVKHLSEVGINNFAVWPMGGEDPGIWSLLSERLDGFDRLIQPSLQRYISYEGEGALIDYGHAARQGVRLFTPQADDPTLLRQDYLALPEPQHLIHWGKMPPNTLLLTFDDGPDPTYTPQVLDILKEKGVPATFFAIGGMMGRDQETMRRMVAEGHIVGTHSYSHPDFNRLGPLRARLELALSQMMFKHVTGYETYVMRLPYAAGTGPEDGRRSRPVKDVTDRGYILAMEDLSPPDWAGLNADGIVQDVVDGTQSGESKVLVLHDGGGPRDNVIEALPMLIDAMRERGYRFIGMDELMGVTAADLMPAIQGQEPLANRTAAGFLSYFSKVLRGLFWVVISVGVVRALLILVASYHDRWRRHYTISKGHPRVDVLVPAYCEESVVVATVNSVLASNYPDLHVIAIDDGSSDNTYDVLLEAFADHPDVTVLHKPNGGKSNALNYALAYSTAEYFVAIDADTLIEPRAVSRLMRHFSNPSIGAVAGNVKVGNRVNMLTRFQALEYITAQNIDRRAMELVNGILVVPGAIGAWRRSAVEAAGAYQSDTLAEDADLTVSVIRAGYETAYEPGAIAITEAPESVRQFFHQRLRWSLGMLQMAWKHRAAFRERRGVGLLALPDLLVFGAIMPLLAPLADFVLLMSVIGWIGKWLPGTHAYAQPPLNWVDICAYIALPLLDVCIAMFAFNLEVGEQRSLIWLVLIKRFWYRQLLYISTIRALWQAVTGRIGGWKKIVRTSALVQAAAQTATPPRMPLPAANITAAPQQEVAAE